MALDNPKHRPSPLSAALQLRGFDASAALCPGPEHVEGLMLPPRSTVAECGGCRAKVVLPELAVHTGQTPACWTCLRGAMADARHMKVTQ